MTDFRMIMSATLGDGPCDDPVPSFEVLTFCDRANPLKNSYLSRAQFSCHTQKLFQCWPFGLPLNEDEWWSPCARVCVFLQAEDRAIVLYIDKFGFCFLTSLVKEYNCCTSWGQVDPE
jgi:hypothetical protein